MLISVVIPARNAAGTLQGTLDALERQTLARESYELLVVDDRSTDETRALVRASKSARLLEMPRRGGSYAARNLGLDHAQGEVIAFTDADCHPVDHWLQQGLSDLDAQAADLLGGYIEVPLHAQPSVTELLDVCWHLDQARFFQLGFSATANLFTRRAVFDRVGTFDGNLTSNGDREFCLRAAAHGFKLAYSPRVVVVHPPRTRARQAVTKGFRLGVGRGQTDVDQAGGRQGKSDRSRWGVRRGFLRLVGKMRALAGGPEVFGIHRVRSQGYEPSRLQLLLIQIAAYLLIDLPQAAGYLVGRVSAETRRLTSSPR
jgi:cellulose synthase/poly-beta-1,6-N-acetylglucosamine synthase-like glycosyltransferase